jgi:hypothetical protein
MENPAVMVVFALIPTLATEDLAKEQQLFAQRWTNATKLEYATL